ncbi:MAG: hypothetical protein ACRC9V_13060 [Aeromonas sp.]
MHSDAALPSPSHHQTKTPSDGITWGFYLAVGCDAGRAPYCLRLFLGAIFGCALIGIGFANTNSILQ